MNIPVAVRDFVLDRHGVDLGVFDEEFLSSTLGDRMAVLHLPKTGDYLSVLEQDPAEGSTLVDALRNRYSEFFRSPMTFAVLEQWILPQLAARHEGTDNPVIRIWSAGCSAGQEPYSIALLCQDLREYRSRIVDYRIVATDISLQNLEAAIAGRYPSHLMHNVRLRHILAYFSKQGENYQLEEGLRSRVSFSRFDLLDSRTSSPPAGIYGDFDLIMCCNVLLYYGLEARAAMMEKLHRNLSEKGGYIITGDAEAILFQTGSQFRQVWPPLPIFHTR